MKISTKGRYALRLMIDLGHHAEEDFVNLRDISQRQEISVKYLEQIINLLNKGGLLLSLRGPNGGYKLAKLPSEYTVGEILRVSEGTLAPVTCLEKEPNPCDRASDCATLELWKGLHQVMNDYLDQVTLQDLIDRDLVSVKKCCI